MNKWLNKANRRVSLGSAAALLISASIFGQILGFMRVQVINGKFPITGPDSTDAYFAAFKLPDLLFYTVAAGAIGVAFMPFLADKLRVNDRKSISELTSSLMNLLGIIMVVLGIALFIFAEPLIKTFISSNLSPEQLHNAVWIMRLISFNPLIFTLSAILISVQQTFGRFFFYALSPIIYNLCIIASAYIFENSLGLKGLGIGALFGALLQLLVVIFGMGGLKFKYMRVISLKNLEFRRVLKQLPARSIDQGIDSINSVVETNRAGVLGTGNISYYENAYTLHMAPIAMVGNTISTAAFPRLNNRLAQGRPDLFKKDFLQILRTMLWIILPIAVVSFFARGYLARLIFKRSAFEISIVFGFLAGAIVFRTLYSIISRYFYAQKDTKTPLLVSLFAIALNIFLAFTLARPEAFGITGLALAQSIVATVEVFLLLGVMMWRDKKLFDTNFWGGVFKIISVTGFTIAAAWIMVKILPFNTRDTGFITLGTKLFFIVMPTFLVHIAVSSLFELEEVKPLIKKAHQIIFKPVRIQ